MTIAVVVSAIVSLTLTPMMCSRILRHQAAKAGNRVGRFFNRAVDRTVEYYGRSLEWVLRYQTMTLLVTLGDAWSPRSGSMSSCRRASCRRRTPA